VVASPSSLIEHEGEAVESRFGSVISRTMASFSALYDVVTNVLGTIVLLGGAVGVVYAFVRWIRRRLRPPTPTAPAVSLGSPWFRPTSATADTARRLTKTRYLTNLDVGFRGINNDDVATIRDVVVGILRIDTGDEVEKRDFVIRAVGPGKAVLIPPVTLLQEFVDGLTEADYEDQIAIWARFTDGSDRRWKVTREPSTGVHSFARL